MDILGLIRLRSSVRVYTDWPVEEEKLRTILEAAILAPNGGNAQPWDFIIIDEIEERTEMADFLNEAHNLFLRNGEETRAIGSRKGTSFTKQCIRRGQ